MEEGKEIRQYLQVLRKRWSIVVTLPIIAALISGLTSYFVLKPVYQASTTLIVGEKASESPQTAGKILNYDVLLANQKLAKTYGAIAQSRTVVQNVIDDLNLTLKVEELNTLISVKPVPDTELLEIKVTSTSPDQAALIANTVVQEFSKAVIDIKKVDSVSIVDKAVIPEKPILPRKILNVLVAFAAGLMTAMGLAFLLEYMDNSVKSSEDVEKLLGIPVLSIIPKGQEGTITMSNSLILLGQTKSPISEAYRMFRTNIQFLGLNQKIKSIMITSSNPGEGKSFAIANLAVCLAQSGKSVLVVDADLRKPVQHKLFSLENEVGLSLALTEVLEQKTDFNSYIRDTAVAGVRILTAGPITSNSAELIGSEGMKHLVEELSEQFDMVLFDSPPTLVATDAAILAQEVDGVILVLSSGRVTKNNAKRSKALLDQVGAKFLGAVLNNVNIKVSEY